MSPTKFVGLVGPGVQLGVLVDTNFGVPFPGP